LIAAFVNVFHNNRMLGPRQSKSVSNLNQRVIKTNFIFVTWRRERYLAGHW